MNNYPINIIHHLGLGDHIIMAPFVAYLSTRYPEVRLACYEHNYSSVKSFYINHPNVKVVSHETKVEWDIKLGHYGELKQNDDENFIDWFYRQIGGKREDFLKYCPILEASQRIGQHITPIEGFIFVHEDKERGFEINLKTKARIIEPFKNGSILSYANWILKAKEIHCIDSSFLHLCEALPTTGELYYHKYARKDSTDNYKFIKDWITL